jgi:hypothetical protein
MNVTMWEHCTSDSTLFGSGKVYCYNSVIITNFELSFAVVGLKISSLLTLALKSPNKMFL